MRQKIYGKYNGHCAYCGKEIEYKDMQVDHLVPQRIMKGIRAEAWAKCEWTQRDKERYGEYKPTGVNDENNLMPSCRRCNHYKRGHALNEFRYYMITLIDRVKDIYIVKVALDYGIIEEKEQWNGKFYFDKFDDNLI